MDNSKKSNPKNQKPDPIAEAGKPKNPAVKTAEPKGPAIPEKVAPLFRSMDWLAMGIAFLMVWVVYLFTLAPEQTLEDSGELCTASYYAGIPHPPGYPFWSVWSWLWTVIVPFGNVAWRVEVGQSFASAMGCGLLALMVSRGSSMLIEGIEELKKVSREWENIICVTSGVVSALLMGYGYYLWKESVVVNRISVFGVPWLLFMVSLLMRWMYAPHQRGYLYFAMFIYGLLVTIHQSLLLGAVGFEILITLVYSRLGRDMWAVNSILYFIIYFFKLKGTIPALNAMTNTQQILFHAVGLGSIAACIWLSLKHNEIGKEWKSVVYMGLAWVVAVCVYFYEPISCMTCPPMQWGYPRTVEGFFHALSRGQYGVGEATNVFQDPGKFVYELKYLVLGLVESFSWLFVFIGIVPIIFLGKMHKRERSWILGLMALYFFLSVLLVWLLNVSPDRSSSELNKVFFTASQALFAILIGYGITLVAAYIATNYEKIRGWLFLGGAIAFVMATVNLLTDTGKLFYGPGGEVGLLEMPRHIVMAMDKNQYGLPVFANLILVAVPLIFIVALFIYRTRGPVLILLALLAITPFCSAMLHWYKCEQRNHWYGYWFGHDMFTPPYLDDSTKQLSYDNVKRAELLKDPKNKSRIYPEMDRHTILYGGTDPGRFCPTYSIFCDSQIPERCKPDQDKKFDRRDCYLITQNALADGTYLNYLRSQYNRSAQQDPAFFSELSKYLFSIMIHTWRLSTGAALDKNIPKDSPEYQYWAAEENKRNLKVADSGLYGVVNTVLTNVLDKPFLAWGAHVEKRRRAEGVYPPAEIYMASPQDSQECFTEYARQKQINANGQIEISGQVDVMNINGMIAKVIFDKNPTNSFYVEESFPLEWMYPYETPFGIIMKINREPLSELPQEVFDLDHKFWSDYSTRLCGNWINYDTSVKEICDFAERTYIRNNYTGYTGARSFVRDEDAQKAFSKLRSSQAGMYAWRCFPRGPQNPNGCTPEYLQKSEAGQKALIRETDFAFKQAFAFCPFSPEAVYRYINFLMPLGRFDDAVLIAETCQKLDPGNEQVVNLVKQLKAIKADSAARTAAMGHLEEMENTAKTNPSNVMNLVTLGATLFSMQQTNRALELFDQALARPEIKANEAGTIATYLAQLNEFGRLETALRKLVAVSPGQAEPNYDLAALLAILGKSEESLKTLSTALEINDRERATNKGAHDLRAALKSDPRFDRVRALPEFQKLLR